MKIPTRWIRSAYGPALLTILAVLGPFAAVRGAAQPVPVPSQFQSIYSALNADLSKFNSTLNAGPVSHAPYLPAAALVNADANAGPQLANPVTLIGVQIQLNELKAMGVKAIMVEVGFPMLYQPFLSSQGLSQTAFVNFYQQVASMVHAAGLKLIVENNTLLVNDIAAGWNAGPFFATLNWTQYQQARAQTALTVAQTMQPDYMVLLEEPNTEANNSGQSQANTPTGSASLLSQMLASVAHAGVAKMHVGAGTGASQANAVSFIQQYVAQPVDFIDFHIYPINLNFLQVALNIINTAAAAGKPVAITECWLWKVADNEIGVITADQARARNPFSFWAPLDAYFIQTVLNLAAHSNMLFVDPYITSYWSAYLPYNNSTESMSPSSIVSQEQIQGSQNEQSAIYTSTALSYNASLVSPPDKTPPSVPAGLNGRSANPNQAYMSWNPSTDNIGVAGYIVLRNGAPIATTASLYYQDSGLAENASYTYSVEAFDLGGNVSGPSVPIHIMIK